MFANIILVPFTMTNATAHDDFRRKRLVNCPASVAGRKGRESIVFKSCRDFRVRRFSINMARDKEGIITQRINLAYGNQRS